jgi:predicted nucleotidyltransferase
LKKLLGELKELVARFADYRVRLVFLFGSYARGNYTNESDIDLLIVADNLPSDPREAYEIFLKQFNLGLRIHPVCLNTNTFRKLLENESTFIMEILEDGRVIYADEAFLSETMEKYREIRKKWSRRGKMWVRIVDQDPP